VLLLGTVDHAVETSDKSPCRLLLDEQAGGALLVKRRRSYRRLRLFFLFVFVGSLGLVVFSLLLADETFGIGPSDDRESGLAVAVSVTSLVGLVSTSVLEWKRHRRESAGDLRSIESQRIALERDRIALEREHLQLERDKQSGDEETKPD